MNSVEEIRRSAQNKVENLVQDNKTKSKILFKTTKQSRKPGSRQQNKVEGLVQDNQYFLKRQTDTGLPVTDGTLFGENITPDLPTEIPTDAVSRRVAWSRLYYESLEG